VFAGVDLLTLSACNTAMEVRSAGGKEVEGFGALAQRLGARSVLASLWPVADASTPVLMREFYRLRRTNPKMSKASGLRQAQLELLTGKVAAASPPSKTNRAQRAKVAGATNTNLPLFTSDLKAPYAHPYYWAPFVLIGNPQ
jgi:CHAT domain-containing protein